MLTVRFRKIGKLGAILQLATMLLVQFAVVAPGLARAVALQNPVEHRHEMQTPCGCSPEKVASHRCCCQNASAHLAPAAETRSCCGKSSTLEKDRHTAPRPERSTPAFSSIPCGCDPNLSPATTENLKFLAPHVLRLFSLRTPRREYLSWLDRYTSRYVPPPDPPPKLSVLG